MKFSTFSFLLLSFFLAKSQSKNLTTVIQKGHGEVVKTIAYSPNGRFVVTGSRDKTAKLWSVASGLEIRTFIGHENTINGVEFSPDGTKIATSSADKTARIWDVKTGKELWSSQIFDSYVTSVSFNPDGKSLAIGGYDNEVLILDTKTYDTIQSFEVTPDRGLGYGIDTDFSPDGKWFGIGQDNRTATIYNTKTWELVYTFKPEEGWCGGCGTYIKFSPNSDFVAKLSNNNHLEEFNLTDGSLRHNYGGEVKDISGLNYNSDGRLLLASDEKNIRVYNSTTKNLDSEISPEVKGINSAVFSPDSKTVLVGGNDNKATLWSLEDRTLKESFSGINNREGEQQSKYDPNNYWQSHIAKYIKYENNLLLTKDGSRFIKGKSGKKVKLIDVKTGKVLMEYHSDEGALCFDFSENEDLLLTGGIDGTAILWNTKSGKLIKSFKGHQHPIFDIHFSHDQTRMVTASWDGSVKVWDINSGKVVSNIDLGNVSASQVLFTKNDLYLIISKRDNTFEMREIDSKGIVREFIAHTENITCLNQDFKRNHFLSGSQDGTISLWDYSSGLLKRKFRHSSGAVYAAIFMDTTIISAGSDRLIRIWDLESGVLLFSLEGHQAEITSLNISQDKKLLVSGDLDGVIKFWDLDTKKEFFEYIQVDQDDFMVKTPDGYFYATEGAQNNIHFVNELEVYEANQFFNEFYRPDLIPKAFDKEIIERGKSMQGMLLRSPPPTLKIASLLSPDQQTAKVFVTITDNGGGSKNLQLYHNSKSIPINSGEIVTEKGLKKYECTLPLVAGHNRFTAKAVSKGNIESMPVGIEVLSNSKAPGGKCHILTIGINQYKNSQMNLNYAKADAQAFADSIRNNTKSIFQSVETYGLFDNEATKENIIRKFNELASIIDMNDVFILYYAGHGSVVEENFYFIPTETVRLYDEDNLKKTAIEAKELQALLENIKALKQVIIMDACQSGNSVELLAQRGSVEEKAIAQLSRSAGIHVFASAGGDQYATEFSSLGHGLFTYVLLEGLNGKADGSTLDGKITIYELKSYLDDQVPELSLEHKGKPQYPFTFSRGHDFPIVIYQK